jgi:phytoene dehydrogenase-like protein
MQAIFEASGEKALAAASAKSFEGFRHGRGVFKMDWALSAPIPWKDASLLRAATVHLGGPFERIARSERSIAKGEEAKFPFVLLSQPTLFDPSRAPTGKQIAWAYCHTPPGSRENLRDAIEDEIERYAPGFRDVILARSEMTTADLEKRNANLVGGDVTGGAFDFWRMLKPRREAGHYEISRERGFYVCSASTPPGPGVHGMCGVAAAAAALRRAAISN